jgi:hypothetical protein
MVSPVAVPSTLAREPRATVAAGMPSDGLKKVLGIFSALLALISGRGVG